MSPMKNRTTRKFIKKKYDRGFVKTSGLLRSKIRNVSEKHGFSETRLLTQWSEIVGKLVSDISDPIKISYSRQRSGASLTLLCTGANAPILQMQIPQIIQRVNSCYGYNAISKVFLTQTDPTGFTKPNIIKSKLHKKLTQQQLQHIETSLENVADIKLRSALEQLSRNILTRS